MFGHQFYVSRDERPLHIKHQDDIDFILKEIRLHK